MYIQTANRPIIRLHVRFDSQQIHWKKVPRNTDPAQIGYLSEKQNETLLSKRYCVP